MSHGSNKLFFFLNCFGFKQINFFLTIFLDLKTSLRKLKRYVSSLEMNGMTPRSSLDKAPPTAVQKCSPLQFTASMCTGRSPKTPSRSSSPISGCSPLTSISTPMSSGRSTPTVSEGQCTPVAPGRSSLPVESGLSILSQEDPLPLPVAVLPTSEDQIIDANSPLDMVCIYVFIFVLYVHINLL